MNRKQFLGLLAGSVFATVLSAAAEEKKSGSVVTLAISGMT